MPHREAGPVCNKVDGKCIGEEWRVFFCICVYCTLQDVTVFFFLSSWLSAGNFGESVLRCEFGCIWALPIAHIPRPSPWAAQRKRIQFGAARVTRFIRIDCHFRTSLCVFHSLGFLLNWLICVLRSIFGTNDIPIGCCS